MIIKLSINIHDLLTKHTVESERVEFKAGWNPESILHTICAFANDFHNLGGGYMVIGVAEQNGQPVLPPIGLLPEQIDVIQKELLNLGNSAISPPYHPLTATYEVQGKTILVLWAPGGETRPYKAKTRLGKMVLEYDMSRSEIMTRMSLKDDEHFRKAYLNTALEKGWIERTIPDKPQSRLQKYRLTALGKQHSVKAK